MTAKNVSVPVDIVVVKRYRIVTLRALFKGKL